MNYEHLRELAIGYNINSSNFDIENVYTFDGNDAIACSMALAKLKTLLASFDRTMEVRFTESFINLDTINTMAKYYRTDFIWNDMSWTAVIFKKMLIIFQCKILLKIKIN